VEYSTPASKGFPVEITQPLLALLKKFDADVFYTGDNFVAIRRDGWYRWFELQSTGVYTESYTTLKIPREMVKHRYTWPATTGNVRPLQYRKEVQ
jgi:hypothetical protein